jgi:hypothetical protein
MKKIFFLPMILILFTSCFSLKSSKNEDPKWISLFNGKDLNDWIVKINKHNVNENYANTFRVENGMMKVSYEGYDTFDQQFGHIFYKKPFSAYFLRVEYRFVGEQANGGEAWAKRNSGVMLHSQDPNTMLKDQNFPISIEGQLLGGNGKNNRTTGNVCTPGTHIEIDGKLFTTHCLSSTSKTYHGDQWVRAEFLVLRDSIVHHIIEGDTVLTYQKPQIGGGSVNVFDPNVKQNGKALTSGYISLQSESHPIEFRKVDIIDLDSYMDDKNKLEKVLLKIKEM